MGVGGMEVGSVFVRLGTREDFRGFEEFEAKKVRAQRVSDIKARLGADVEVRDFDLYERKLAEVRAKTELRKAYRATLGADYDSRAFNAYYRDLQKADAAAAKAATAPGRLSTVLNTLAKSASGAGGALGGGGGLTGRLGVLGGSLVPVLGTLATLTAVLLAVAGATAAVAGSFAAAAVGAAVVGVGVAAALGPLAVLAGAVASRVSAMSEAFKALGTVQEKSGRSSAAAAKSHASSAAAIKSAEQQLADARRTGAESVQKAEQSLADARESNAGSVADAEDALRTARVTAANDVRQAEQQLFDAHRSGELAVAQAEQSVADTRVRGAADVKAAESALADAQADATAAQRRLTEARVAARRENEDLARSAEHAKLAEEGAGLALEEAEKRLAEVLADPKSTSLDIREAQYAVNQAKEGVKDAQTARKRADEDATTGTKTVQDARDQLAAANLRVAKAETDLRTAQTDGAKALARAISDEARTRADASRTVSDAEQHLTETKQTGKTTQGDAEKTLATTTKTAARAIADAQLQVGRARSDEARSTARAIEAVTAARTAQTEALQSQTGAAQSAKEKLGELDSTERKLVTTARGLVDELSRTFRPATDAIFGSVDKGLALVTPLLGRYRSKFEDLGEEVGGVVFHAVQSFTGPDWTRALDAFIGTAQKIVKPLSDSVGSVLVILRNIAVATQPLVVDLARNIANALGGLADKTKDPTKVRDVIASLVDQTKTWLGLTGAVAKLLFTIFSGGARQGQGLVDQVTGIVRKWTAFLETDEGQRKMRKFFEDSIEMTKKIAGFLGDVLTAFYKVGDFLIKHTDLIKAAALAWGGYKVAALTALAATKAAALTSFVRGPTAVAGATAGSALLTKGNPLVGAAAGSGAAAAGGIGGAAIATGVGAAALGGYLVLMNLLERKSRQLGDGLQVAVTAAKQFAEAGDPESVRKLSASIDDWGKKTGATKAQIGKLKDVLAGFETAAERNVGGVGKVLDQSAKNFDGWRKTGSNSLQGLHTATAENMNFIKRTLGEDSAAGRAALVGNFKLAEEAVRQAMSDGKVTTRDGMREIRRLMKEELAVYGIKGQAATDYMRTGGHGSGNEEAGYTGGRARGGYVRRATGGWIGARGMVSDDFVPVGDNTIAALGEYLAVDSSGRKAVINRHQAPVADAALAASGMGSLDTLPAHNSLSMIERALAPLGGLDNLFASIDRPHYLATGGYVQGAVPAGGPAAAALAREMFAKGFNVTSAKRNTPTFHGEAGDGRGDALDFGDSANDLHKVWGVLFPRRAQFAELFGPSSFAGLFHGTQKFTDAKLQAGHQDHVHVAIVKKLIGALGSAAAKVRIPKVIGGGALGGIVQGALNVTGGAANRRLAQAADTRPGDELSVGAAGPDAGVVAAFRRAIRSTKAKPIERLALWEAGIVESGLRNLQGGDADSEGALQERVSIYGRAHARNPLASAARFINDAIRLRPWKSTAGMLAAAVQRPRADLRGRYDAVAAQARKYLARGGMVGLAGGGRVPTLAPGANSSRPQTTTGPGTTDIKAPAALQRTRIKNYDNLATKIGDAQKRYEQADRRYDQSDEVFINPDTGELDQAAIEKRAGELDALMKIRERILKYLEDQLKIASRVVKTYTTIIGRLNRSLTHARGKDRSGVRKQIAEFEGDRSTWEGNVRGRRSDITDAKLDIGDIRKEGSELRGIHAEPGEVPAADADDSSSDAPADTTTDATPAAPTPADIAAAAIAELAAFNTGRADLLKGYAGNFISSMDATRPGGPAGPSPDDLALGAGARFFGASGSGATGGQQGRTVTITNNYNQLPDDTQTWNSQMRYTVESAA